MDEATEPRCDGAGAGPVARTGPVHVGGVVSVPAGFGTCPVCGQSVRLTDDGLVGRHKPVPRDLP